MSNMLNGELARDGLHATGRRGSRLEPTESGGGSAAAAPRIAAFLRILFEPGDVFEVRLPGCLQGSHSDFRATASGYFTHEQIEHAAEAVARLDRQSLAAGTFVTINPVRPDLLARAMSRIHLKAKSTTGDGDIVRRRWILVDLDPVRPTGISSTAAELSLARAKCDAIQEFFRGKGWPEPVVVMSGNGYHLLLRVDLPIEDGGLVGRVLAALAARFDDDQVKVDCSVDNPSHLTKVAGTTARKGDDVRGVPGIEDRPHRLSVLEHAPDRLDAAPTELLEALAADASRAESSRKGKVPHRPPGASQSQQSRAGAFATFEHTPDGVARYLESHGLHITGRVRKQDATWLHLDRCPIVTDCQATSGSDIAVVVGDDGIIGYKNLHSRGAGLGWLDVREALEPGYRSHVEALRHPDRGSQKGVPETVAEPWEEPTPLVGIQVPAPFPLDRAFPPNLGMVRDYVAAAAESLQVAVDAPAMMLLAVISACYAKYAEIQLRPGWLEPAPIWSLVLMESAERKSGVAQMILAPVHRWEKDEAARLSPELAIAAGARSVEEKRLALLRDQLARKPEERQSIQEEADALSARLAATGPVLPPRLITTEPTPEALAEIMAANHERALLACAEADALDVLLGRYSERGQPNLGIYLAGHSGDNCRFDRRGRPSLHLVRPALSMALIVQPEAVRAMFTSRTAKGRGLLARFLKSVPPSRLGRRKVNPATMPVEPGMAYAAVVRFLLSLPIPESDGVAVIELSPTAQQKFDAFCAEIEPRLGRGGDLGGPGTKAWGGKLCGAVARIALALHMFEAALLQSADRIAIPVTAATLEAALEWAPYLIEQEQAVGSVVGADPELGAAERLLAWIERGDGGGFTKRDAFNALRSFEVKRADDVDPMLRLLVEHGYIRPGAASTPRSKAGRKPSPSYEVNPLWKREVACAS